MMTVEEFDDCFEGINNASVRKELLKSLNQCRYCWRINIWFYSKESLGVWNWLKKPKEKVTQSVIEVQRKVELAKIHILVATEPTEKYYLINLFTDYEDSWELLATLGMQNMSDKEKKLWLLDHMFLKDKSEKWSTLFMMLGSQKLTVKVFE